MTKATDTARLLVSVSPASGPDTFPNVELAGTRDGLVWLAEQILQAAHAQPDQPEYHTHLDAEACAPVYVSPDGWWLTIRREERRRQRAKQA